MRTAWMVVGLSLLMLALCGSASVPSDAKPIELDQTITDYAPGYYYKVDVPTPGTLEVILEEVPADMETRINVLNEADSWLADEMTTAPGQKITVEARADAPGTYYIGVMDLHGVNHETPYSFRVTLRS
jgi:hypothetical protein